MCLMYLSTFHSFCKLLFTLICCVYTVFTFRVHQRRHDTKMAKENTRLHRTMRLTVVRRGANCLSRSSVGIAPLIPQVVCQAEVTGVQGLQRAVEGVHGSTVDVVAIFRSSVFVAVSVLPVFQSSVDDYARCQQEKDQQAPHDGISSQQIKNQPTFTVRFYQHVTFNTINES